MCSRSGWTIEATAERFQVDAKTVRKWRDRFLAEGDAGLLDRSSRPHRSPKRTNAKRPRQVLYLRRKHRWGADHIAHETGLAASTVQSDPARRRLRPARSRRPRHRHRAGASLPARTPRRVDPRRRQEDRRHPQRWRLAAPRPRRRRYTRHNGPATATSTPRSMTAPGSSTPRSTTTNKPSPPPGSGTAPPPGSRPRHHLRTSPHRQRLLLQVRTLAPRLQRDRHHRQEDPATPPANQRQDRTLPPHPARGMGLHPPLDLRPTTHAALRPIHPLLQSPPPPRRARLVNPNRDPEHLTDNVPGDHS